MIDQSNEKRDHATEGAADHSGNRIQVQGNSTLAAFQSQQLVIAGDSKETNKLKSNYMVKKAMSKDVFQLALKKIRFLAECLNLYHADLLMAA